MGKSGVILGLVYKQRFWTVLCVSKPKFNQSLNFSVSKMLVMVILDHETRWPYRSAPQVANLGGHPVQPPFKIPESIIIYYFLVASDMRISFNIYVHLNVTKFDRHIFV